MFIAHCIHNFTASHGLPASLFLAGLAGGFTHCSGMCAPFVLAQIEEKTTDTGMVQRLKGAVLLPYHLGRMLTYVCLSVVFYGFINLAFLFSESRIILTIPILMMAALLFLTSLFPVLAKIFPWAVKLQLPVSYSLINKISAKLLYSPGLIKRFALGVLLGFMPCGMVIGAIMAAGTAPTIQIAALSMAAFAIGTIPALVLVGLGGQFLLVHYPAAKQRIRQSAIALSAIWLFVLAGTMMF